jgi:TolB protein
MPNSSKLRFSYLSAGLLVLLWATKTTGAVHPLSGQKLLVTSIRTGDTEVFIADPVTGDLLNVSRSPGSEDRYPCWSPGGTQIAFVSDRQQATNLYVMDANGDHVHRIITTPAVCYMPSWQVTPDGERIVFGMHGDKPEMASIRPDGSSLANLGQGHDPTLSPDGRRICYTGEVPEGGVSVFTMRWDGSDKRRLVARASKPGATFPNWSPDGKFIVYSWPVSEALELFVIASDGGSEPRQVTRTGSICTPAAWSPDGQWISFRFTDEAYWRNKERMREVYTKKPADKRPVWIVRPDGSDAQVIEPLRFQMSIDGSRASWKPINHSE